MTDEIEPITLDNTRDVDYGRVATKSIFKQFNHSGTEDINEWRERFVAELDPTEYKGGVALVGSWKDWERFKRNWPSFQKLYLDDWMDEIEIRLKSLAINALKLDSYKGNSASAKFLAEGKYKEKKPGRPNKGDVQRQTKIDAALDREIEEDIARIGA